MADKEAKSATEIKFLNATACNNFFYSTYSFSSGLCENDTKYVGRNSQFQWFHRKKIIKRQKNNELFIKNKIEFSIPAISSKI